MANISAESSQKIKNMSIICAMFVVTIHVGWPTDSSLLSTWWIHRIFTNGISRIAVPFFFVISGYFLSQHFGETGWWRRESWKRVHSLLIPFVFWSLASFLSTIPLSIVADLIAHRPFGTSINVETDNLIRLLGFDLTDYPLLIPLWYVRCLMFFVIVSPLFKFVTTKFSMFWLMGIYLLSFFGSHIFSDNTAKFLGCGFSLSGIFYFSAGLYLGLHNPPEIPRRISRSIIFTGLFLLIAKVYLSYNQLRFEQSVGKLMIPFLLYSAWYIMPAAKWPTWLTGCSFPIFLMHMITFPYFGILCKHLPKINDQLHAYLSCLIGITVPIIIVNVAKRCFPKMTAFIFAGRM